MYTRWRSDWCIRIHFFFLLYRYCCICICIHICICCFRPKGTIILIFFVISIIDTVIAICRLIYVKHNLIVYCVCSSCKCSSYVIFTIFFLKRSKIVMEVIIRILKWHYCCWRCSWLLWWGIKNLRMSICHLSVVCQHIIHICYFMWHVVHVMIIIIVIVVCYLLWLKWCILLIILHWWIAIIIAIIIEINIFVSIAIIIILLLLLLFLWEVHW